MPHCTRNAWLGAVVPSQGGVHLPEAVKSAMYVASRRVAEHQKAADDARRARGGSALLRSLSRRVSFIKPVTRVVRIPTTC